MTSNFNKRKLTDLQKSNTKVPNCSFKRVKGEVRNEVQGVQVQELIKEETKEEFDNLNGICIKKEPKSDSELKTYETDKKEDDLSLLTDYKKFLFVAVFIFINKIFLISNVNDNYLYYCINCVLLKIYILNS